MQDTFHAAEGMITVSLSPSSDAMPEETVLIPLLLESKPMGDDDTEKGSDGDINHEEITEGEITGARRRPPRHRHITFNSEQEEITGEAEITDRCNSKSPCDFPRLITRRRPMS